MTSIRLLLAICGTAFLAQLLPRYFDGGWGGWAVTVPGVFLHEAAHYGFALLLDGSPGSFSIVPSFSGGQMISYGHITFAPTHLNAATVALAPLLVAPASAWLVAISARVPLLLKPLTIWMAAAGFYSATPSGQDLSIALSYPLSFAPATVILTVSCYIWWRMIRYELSRIGRG